MLKSMTAFARQDIETPQGILTWEIRSVNHRYLEPHFRVPDAFREAEPLLREALRKSLARGKIDCNLKLQNSLTSEEHLQLNTSLIASLKKAHDDISAVFGSAQSPDPMSILGWPGVINAPEQNQKEMISASLNCFKAALKVLVQNRAREGEQLGPLLESRLSRISEIVAEVRQELPKILNKQNTQIKQRFDDAKVELDPQRLEQEMVLLAQKSDVAEELDRLDTHVTEVRSILKRQEPVGRRLDFLMQELNREANTLSSKAIVTETTNAAVELKVLIEQMREQIQNIE